MLGSGLSALTVGTTGWVAVRSAAARDDLDAARAEIVQMQADLAAGRASGVPAALTRAQTHARAATRLTGDPAWTLAAGVPYIGRPVAAVRGLAQAADELSNRVLPDLVAAIPPHEPRAPRSVSDQGAADLAVISRAAAPLADADRGLADITARLASLPRHTGVAEIDAAQAEFAARLTHLKQTVAAASSAARLLPALLGADGPRRYFLAFQTNAEARGTGGLVGAYGVVIADHGHVSFPQLASDDTIQPADRPVADFGPEFTALYGADESTQLLSNSNLSPHFPYAAQIWTGLWKRQTGQQLDGVIATDPVGLADLLTALGPVTLANGEQVTAANAVELTEQTSYVRYPDPTARKRYLIHIATQVVEALLNRPHDLTDLLRALAHTVGGGHLLMWSSDPAQESELSTTPVGGVLPQNPGPFAELVVNNASGTKLDYYLDRSLSYTLGGCRRDSRTSVVQVRLTNGAPATGLPAYVGDRMDEPTHVHARGSNKLWVSLYASVGAQLEAASLDGVQQPLSSNLERGHPVFGTNIELEPGQTRTLELSLTEPVSTTPPVVPQQPLTRPQVTHVAVERCR